VPSRTTIADWQHFYGRLAPPCPCRHLGHLCPKRENRRHSAMSDLQHQRPHCWECRRRRLVCDGTQPVCNKCRLLGIVCPGFADKQPLKWLAPGQVMSRARRRKVPRKTNDSAKGPTKATTASTRFIEDQQTDELDVVLPVELRPESSDAFEALIYCTSRHHTQLDRKCDRPRRPN
jgi:hypothetical protein